MREWLHLLISDGAATASARNPAEGPELCAERGDQVRRVVWVV